MRQDDLNDAGPRLGRLDDYEVADGYPDVRGWTVRSADGRDLGTVKDLLVDLDALEVTHLDVALDGDAALTADGRTRVPIEDVQFDRNTDSVLVSGALYGGATYADVDATRTAGTLGTAGAVGAAGFADVGDRGLDVGRRDVGMDDRNEIRVERVEEELSIGKRRVSAGQIGIRKRVDTERVSQPVTTQRDEVSVERRPVAADSASALTPTMGEDEIRVPIVEEELVVEKRPVVKEEIVIRTKAVTEQQQVEADVRRERVDVDRQETPIRPAVDRREDDRGRL